MSDMLNIIKEDIKFRLNYHGEYRDFHEIPENHRYSFLKCQYLYLEDLFRNSVSNKDILNFYKYFVIQTYKDLYLLSEIYFKDLNVGDIVRSLYTGVYGEIVALDYNRDRYPLPEDNWLSIKWKNDKESCLYHCECKNVEYIQSVSE